MISLPWYIAGPIIGLMVPLLLVLREKQLGVSSSFRAAGSYLFPKWTYLREHRGKDLWQLSFVFGILLISVVAALTGLEIEPSINNAQEYGVQAQTIYSLDNWALFLIGGVFVGFGARYANGCTAGHCIMGNALFSVNSLITTIAFFAGGLLVTYLILPQIFE